MESAMRIADQIIRRGRFNALQIIKTAYISHGYHMAIHGEPLIHDVIEAWQYGPVIPVLYYALRRHGQMPVLESAYCKGMEPLPLDAGTAALLDRVVEIYGGMSGNTMSALTRDDAWRSTEQGAEMDNHAIQRCFE